MSSRTATTNADNPNPRRKNLHMARRAASRSSLGRYVRIRDAADGGCNHARQLRKGLSGDVETEGHRAQDEANDGLIEPYRIDRRQRSQQGLEPEPHQLLPGRPRVVPGVLGEPTNCEGESKEPTDEVDGRPQRHEQHQAGRVQQVDDDHAGDIGRARQDPEEVERGEPALSLKDRDAEAKGEDSRR